MPQRQHNRFRRTFLVCFAFLNIVLRSLPAQAENIKEIYEKAADAFNNQQYDAAIDGYNQIISSMPNFAPAYNGIGLAIKARDDDNDEAIKYFLLAVRNDPNFSQGYENLGRMYYAKGDYLQAQRYFEKTISIDPTSVNALLNLGWIYLLAKSNPIKAQKYFSKAYTLNQSPNVYFALGMAYFSNNDRVKALEVVTNLRHAHQDDLASRLEKSIRENRHVNLDPIASEKPTDTAAITPPKPAPVEPKAPQPSGVKVRLSGKLDDLK